MKRRIIPLLLMIFLLSGVLAGCAGKTDTDASASPGTSSAASESTASSPAVSLTPDSFVIGTVTAINDNTLTVATVNPDGTKTITVGDGTTYTISGSKKTAALSDISVGDVISVTLNGTTAIKVIDNGPDINPDPSAYVSPSPSDAVS